jgi:biotin synthase-like enzyme
MVRDAGMEVCCGGILGKGKTLEQRAEFAADLAELGPDEVPLSFLNPRPGTPFGELEVMPASEALKSVAAFRLALPPCCGSPAAARSRWATSAPSGASWVASTPSSSATT